MYAVYASILIVHRIVICKLGFHFARQEESAQMMISVCGEMCFSNKEHRLSILPQRVYDPRQDMFIIYMGPI